MRTWCVQCRELPSPLHSHMHEQAQRADDGEQGPSHSQVRRHQAENESVNGDQHDCPGGEKHRARR